jgi:phage terminase large subunit
MKIKGLSKWILPVYWPYVRDYETRFNVYYGGAGSGKSHFVAQKILLKCLQYKRKLLVVRKVGNTLKDSVWAMFLKLLYQMSAVIRSVNKSEYTIELINGSIILFKGFDDPEKIKSIEGITDIVVEEASELTEDDFDQLNLRLRAKSGMLQIHLMFNPVSKANWVYRRFFENGTPEDTVIIHTTYKDNPHLPQEYIDSLLRLEKTNPAYFKIYVLGAFATLDKLVFPVKTVRLISQEEVKGLLFWIGMDFGYTNDPTAITWGYCDNIHKILYITGEYNKKGMTNDVIATTIKDLGFAKERIVADAAEPKSIAELRRLGINRIIGATKGPDSVKNGIDRLQRYDIIIDERCPNTIEEFENYTWVKDKKTGEYINQPVDTFNHHIDSIRYGTQNVMKQKMHADEELAGYMFL